MTDAILATNAVFAPDGESIVFTTVAEGGPALRRVAVSGGVASTITTLEGIPSFSGISWSGDGILIAGRGKGECRDSAGERQWWRAGTAGQYGPGGDFPRTSVAAGRQDGALHGRTEYGR